MTRSSGLVLALALTTLSSSGCSWLFGDEGSFRDRGDDYRQAKMEKALDIPMQLDSDAIDDRFAIPPITDRTSLVSVFEVPRPEPLAEDINRDTVKINRLAEQRWILVDGSPGEVWPKLRGFLSLNQLAVARADAVVGIIDTSWLQPNGEGLSQERYRLRIEQGVQRGSSEVYVLQADTLSGQSSWPTSSSNLDRENIMIEELAQYLADSSGTTAAVSMLAQQAIDSTGKIVIEEDDAAVPYIKLELPFPRAWASVGKSLSKAGYFISDLDRSQKIYYLRYDIEREKQGEPGFFASLFDWSDDDEDPATQGIGYKLQLREHDENTVIIAIDRQQPDEVMEEGEAKHLLTLIKRHIT